MTAQKHAVGSRSTTSAVVAFRDLLDNDGRYQAHDLGDPREALAVIQYTGGTTGSPKGAMLTHANLTAACAQYMETATRTDPPSMLEGEERIALRAAAVPHLCAFGRSCCSACGWAPSSSCIRASTRPAAAKDIALKKITVFAGVPTMHVALLSLPGVERWISPRSSSALRAARRCRSRCSRSFESCAGCRLSEGWGMSETSPIGTFTPRHGPVKPGSCGIPCRAIEIKFVDVADPEREVALGERGELCIRGPNVMKGYWKKPEATREAMTSDGFFRTGDVGYMDEDGYVFIVDRTKDMLLVGGFNVYPRNIEEAIYQHPSVEEASVIGVPDAYRGETPKAFVKLKAGAPPLTLDELKEFLKDRLGKHEMIGALEIRDELPKTAVGKISKKDLRASERERTG